MAQQVGPNTWEFEIPGGQKVRGNGASEQEARRDARLSYNRMATAPPPGISTGTPEQRRQQDIVGKVKEALLGPPVTGAELGGDIRDPKTLLTGARALGQMVTPGSIPEAAVMAVLPFAGKFAGAAVGAGTDLASQVGRVAARVGAPTAAGAVAGAVTGGKEGAAKGAELGLTAAAVGEAFQATGSLVEAAARKWGNLDTQAYNTRVANVLGPELGHRIEQDIPSLKGHVNNVSSIIKLTDEQTGRKILADMFDRTEAKIGQVLKNQRFQIDEDIIRISQGKPLRADVGEIVQMPGKPAQPATPGASAQAAAKILGPRGETLIDKPATAATPGTPAQKATTTPTLVLDANDVLGVAKRLRFIASQKDNPLAFPAKEKAEELLNMVTGKLREFDIADTGGPASRYSPYRSNSLADNYEGLRQDYRKFMKLRDFLSTTTDKLFPSAAAGRKPTIDLLLFGDRTIQNFADVSPSDFPAIHEMFTGPGGAAGTRPAPGAAIPLLGHARASTPVPGMSGVRAYEGGRFATKERLPQHLQDKVGTQLGEKIAAVGRATAAGATPSISEAQQ